MIVKQTDSKVYTCPIAGTRRREKLRKRISLWKKSFLQMKRREQNM